MSKPEKTYRFGEFELTNEIRPVNDRQSMYHSVETWLELFPHIVKRHWLEEWTKEPLRAEFETKPRNVGDNLTWGLFVNCDKIKVIIEEIPEGER